MTARKKAKKIMGLPKQPTPKGHPVSQGMSLREAGRKAMRAEREVGQYAPDRDPDVEATGRSGYAQDLYPHGAQLPYPLG